MTSAFLVLLAVSQLDSFDAANLALTSCAYSAFRQANAAGVSEGEFERTLDASCASEIQSLHREIVAIERSRGESASRADAFADRQIARFHADFRQQYARRGETESQLRELERALKEEGNR